MVRRWIDGFVARDVHVWVAVDALDKAAAVLADEHDGDAAVAGGEPGAAFGTGAEGERVLNDSGGLLKFIDARWLRDDVIRRGFVGSRGCAEVLRATMNRSWGSRQFSAIGETWRKRIKVRGFYTSVRGGEGRRRRSGRRKVGASRTFTSSSDSIRSGTVKSDRPAFTTTLDRRVDRR